MSADVALLGRQVDDLRRQLAEAEGRSAKACRARSTFLANMSHELRTPLNAIIGYSELVAEELEGQELHDDVSRIHGAAQRLLCVISDVLDLARIEAGRMAVSMEGVDPRSLIHEAVQLIEAKSTHNGNQIVLDLGDLPMLLTDGGKVAQIIQNLVDNAAKFTHGGTINVSATVVDDCLVVKVSDDGIGIDADCLVHLFDAFTQGDASTTRRYGGIGLGLALCRSFADMLGGTLEATSQVGVGSVFRLSMPVELAPRGVVRMPGAHELTMSHRMSHQDRELVLVIDDDPSVHDVVRRTLEPLGFMVRVASSGEEGLRLARTLQPQLVILDVLMPGMDGFAVLQELRNDPMLSDTQVLLMSMLDERNKAATLGASDYLVKPVGRGELVSTVERLLTNNQGTILVAEDDASTREMVRRTLVKQGWSVVEAADGRAALHILKTIPVHAVLLDLMMPEMDGFEVAVAMREDPELEDIPVVVLTAMDLTAHDLSRLRGRVENVLLKGAFGPRDLLRQVRHLVRPFAPAPLADEPVCNVVGLNP